MNWKLLSVFGIPFAFLIGVIITYPSLWATPIAWQPINADYADDKCYGKKESFFTGIDLYDCDSGKVYLDVTTVKVVEKEKLREHCFWGDYPNETS